MANPDKAISTLLACAAVEPGLRSILCFDDAPDAVDRIAQRMHALLAKAGEKQIRTVTLGPVDSEDDLWGRLRLNASKSGARLECLPGRLTGRDGELVLVKIPDLTRLSLAGQRACVALLGSDAGHLERNGQSAVWAANYCWVAACPRERVGELSPHLLDRFLVRISQPLDAVTRAQRIESLRRDIRSVNSPSLTDIPDSPIRRGAVEVEEDLFQEVLRYTSGAAPSPRRELALARVAVNLARLKGAPSAGPSYVKQAARLIGWNVPVNKEEAPDDPVPPPASHPKSDDTGAGGSKPRDTKPNEPEPSFASIELQPVATETFDPDQTEVFAAAAVAANPYGEDTAPVQRDLLSLRLPPGRTTASRSSDGVIVGTEPARYLRDIAWVPTILEAAKYRIVRGRNSKLLITRGDLRANRRAPVPRRALMVVLDHTCLSGVDWEAALGPHLFWAYAQRATIAVAQVGARSLASGSELGARLVTGRNLLASAVIQAFEDPAGAATPLAHGLDLALQHLRHSLQHGRAKVDGARLVVVTDGLGNIPLAASRAGELTAPAGSQGIEDALRVAAEVGKLAGVESHLLYPPHEFFPELPAQYRDALRAMTASEMAANGGTP